VAFTRTGRPVRTDVHELVDAAFAHRRKTLANSVSLTGRASRGRVEEALAAIGKPAGARAEELAPQEFVALAEALR
jgi:16S rRNA (adenine1518-N6/adenine1519-N6)-dimethyltransferase